MIALAFFALRGDVMFHDIKTPTLAVRCVWDLQPTTLYRDFFLYSFAATQPVEGVSLLFRDLRAGGQYFAPILNAFFRREFPEYMAFLHDHGKELSPLFEYFLFGGDLPCKQSFLDTGERQILCEACFDKACLEGYIPRYNDDFRILQDCVNTTLALLQSSLIEADIHECS